MANQINRKKLFIRFNELPENGQSFIYDDNNIICGRREGVSVYDAIKVDGIYTPKLPRYASKDTVNEFNKYTYDNTSGEYEKIYLVTGDMVAEDERHCPIITNVEILDELNLDDIFPGRHEVSEPVNTEYTADEESIDDTETQTTDESQTNRVDDFVDAVKETTKQVKDEVKNGIDSATAEIEDFISEVRESETAANVRTSLKDAKDHMSKFAKSFAKASSAFMNTFSEKDKEND